MLWPPGIEWQFQLATSFGFMTTGSSYNAKAPPPDSRYLYDYGTIEDPGSMRGEICDLNRSKGASSQREYQLEVRGGDVHSADVHVNGVRTVAP
jgi:hypothetical protein